MDKIIEFIINNYVWFIVIAIIITMAIIGYIADKTEFGRKKEKKEVEQNNEIISTTLENQNVDINKNNYVSNESVVEIMSEGEKVEESSFVPLSNNNEDQPVYIDPSPNMNVEQNNEDVNNNDIWQF